MNKNAITWIMLLPFLGACHSNEKKEEAPPGELYLTDSLKKVVTLDTIRKTELHNELLLNGRVTYNPEQTAHVYPIFGGTITDIKAEIGDYVEKGKTLAIIRSGEAADYEKQMKEVELQIKLTQRNLQATQDLYTGGMSSEKDVMEARQEVTRTQAEEKRLKELKSIYHLSGNATYEIKSPVSGFVVERTVSPNMQLRSDQENEIFTISGLENVWIMADVYESDISKVHEGAKVRITTLAYGDQEFWGTIDKVYNVLNEESKTMSVRVRLPNKGYRLKPGMFTNVYVQCKGTRSTLPQCDSHAVIFENGKQYVVKVDPKGALNRQEVRIFKQIGTTCYIEDGVKDGDRVIRNNALLVYNALK